MCFLVIFLKNFRFLFLQKWFVFTVQEYNLLVKLSRLQLQMLPLPIFVLIIKLCLALPFLFDTFLVYWLIFRFYFFRKEKEEVSSTRTIAKFNFNDFKKQIKKKRWKSGKRRIPERISRNEVKQKEQLYVVVLWILIFDQKIGKSWKMDCAIWENQ